MRLGLYYHVTIHQKDNELYLPAYFALFIDELAKQVTELFLFLHPAEGNEIKEADTQLTAKNIKYIDIGRRRSAWYRSFFSSKFIKPINEQLNQIDVLLVRSPSPLAPYFKNHIPPQKITYMVVGDYLEGAKQFKIKSLRDWIITIYLKHNDWKLRQAMRNNLILVNSPVLLEQYKFISSNLHLIKTTTLTEHDFYLRSFDNKNDTVNILYTGRIDRSKGITELFKATYQVKNKGFDIHLHIVGWDDSKEQEYSKELLTFCAENQLTDNVTFHGKKKAGRELNGYYRMADIYTIPSYFEGFPRTIWEAMANSLPVIATKVGGIPFYLTSQKNAVLITPKSVDELTDAMIDLIKNPGKRKALAIEGLKLAQENTLPVQTSKLISLIKSHAGN